MKEKIKKNKGFIQIPLLIGIIISIVFTTGIGYGAVEYNKTTNLVKESQQLAKEEKYSDAIAKLESAKSGWVTNFLGVKKQEITNEIENNKKLLEDKSEYAQGIEEFTKENWKQAKDLFSKVSETSPYYQDAKNKIEEAQNKITEKQVAEAVKKTEEKAQVEKQITQEEITKLQLEKQTAEEQWAEADKKQKIEQLLSIGTSLQSYYNEIRDAYHLGTPLCLYSSQCEVNFWADLAKHDMGALSWPKYESTYYSLTSTHSYQDARNILDKVVFSLYAAGVSSYKVSSSYEDSDYEKIKKILGFINSNIHYEQDMKETPRAPAETLGHRSGDCKSYSILTSAAFAEAGIDSAVMLVKSVDGTQAHAMILVQSKETLPLWSYSDLTQYGLPSGKWWVIEPQYTFEKQQQHPEWFTQWRIEAAALVEAPY